MRRTAFTLLEVLMAFAAGSMLIGVIYFFYFGMLGGGKKTQDKLELSRFAEEALSALQHDLRLTYQVTELKPDRLLLACVSSEPVSGEGYSQDELKLQSVEYKVEMRGDSEGRQHAALTRRHEFDQPSEIFSVDACEKELFSGMVLDMPREKEDTFPRFHLFDMVSHTSSDVPHITSIRLHLALTQGRDHLTMQTKVFLPIAYSRTVQAEWNIE